jgi:3-methyladenine DNA glycosylase AlkD
MNPIVSKIRQELASMANPVVAENSKRFFKDDEVVKMYGIKAPDVYRLSKEAMKTLTSTTKEECFELCEELMKSGMIEEFAIACDIAYHQRKSYNPTDFVLFEKWVHTYVTSWAHCDGLCNHTVGTFIEMYPEFMTELKKWAKSNHRWDRRASAVTLIIPARKGLFLNDIFEIATTLLLDTDHIVQKGYGWMLKAASQAHCNEVFNFVNSYKETMPRTALRYAIEKMPENLKKAAMLK